MADSDDRIVSTVIAATGSIPVVATLVTGSRFGVAATIGLGVVVIGLGSLANAVGGTSLPRARVRRRTPR